MTTKQKVLLATSTLAAAIAIAVGITQHACTPDQQAKVLPVLTEVEAVARQAGNVLDWIDQNLPGDEGLQNKLKAAREAWDRKDYVYAMQVADVLLKELAQRGVTVPVDVVAQQKTTGAAAAGAIGAGMTALSDPNKHWVDAGVQP